MSITAKKFNQGLKDWAPVTQKNMSNTQIYRLIDYLVQEDKGKVSLNKLAQAFALHDNDRPLKQFGIEDLINYQNEMANELERETTGHGKTPVAVFHLLAFIQNNGLNIDGIFGAQNSTKIQDTSFISALNRVNYDFSD